jgi:hypothetical protein
MKRVFTSDSMVSTVLLPAIPWVKWIVPTSSPFLLIEYSNLFCWACVLIAMLSSAISVNLIGFILYIFNFLEKAIPFPANAEFAG